ncbi:MAG: hypothetical protein ABI181_04175 [Mycobacteriaceae bacterium]
MTQHPFVLATADGTLTEAAFDGWLLEDHAFVMAFRRFLAGAVVIAPDERARDLLCGGLAALTGELALFRDELAQRGLDADTHAPSLTCIGYAGWMQASLEDGWEVALVVLHGVERAYLDAWTAVRERSVGQRYDQFVRNWSSPEFAAWVEELAGLLGDGAPTAAQQRAHDRVTEWEHAFWNTVHAG